MVVPVEIEKNLRPENIILINKFDVVNVSIRDTLKIIYPKNVLGFVIGKKHYQSIEIKSEKGSAYIFAEVLQKGKAEVYYYSGKLFGAGEVYLFRKRGENFYYVSLEEKASGGAEGSQGGGLSMPPDLLYNQQFNKLLQNVSQQSVFNARFIPYFSDCPTIQNKLKQEWYTTSSLSVMFKEYNEICADK